MSDRNLDKWEQLLIRGCKSNCDLIVRCRKIWVRRIGIKTQSNGEYIAHALFKILHKRSRGFSDRDMMEYLHGMSDQEPFGKCIGGELPYWDRVIFNLGIIIMSTEIKEWVNYTPTGRFRNRNL